MEMKYLARQDAFIYTCPDWEKNENCRGIIPCIVEEFKPKNKIQKGAMKQLRNVLSSR